MSNSNLPHNDLSVGYRAGQEDSEAWRLLRELVALVMSGADMRLSAEMLLLERIYLDAKRAVEKRNETRKEVQ